MNQLIQVFIFCWTLLFSTNAISQNVYVGKNKKMYLYNNTSNTYFFKVEKDGEAINSAHLRPKESMPLGDKAKPRFFKSISFQMDYDLTSYRRDKAARYEYFKREGRKQSIYKSISIAVFDYLTRGVISEDLLGMVETLTEEEKKEYSKRVTKLIEEAEAELDKAISKEKDREIRAAVICAIILAKELRKSELQAQKQSEATAYMIGSSKFFEVEEFMQKHHKFPLFLDVGFPVTNDYIYRGSENLESTHTFGAVIPYHIQLTHQTNRSRSSRTAYSLGLAYSRSPLIYRDTIDANFPEGVGYSFSHFDANVGANVRNHGQVGFGLGIELGVRVSFSNRHIYFEGENDIQLSESDKLTYEETRFLIGVSAHLKFKHFLVFGKWHLVSVPPESVDVVLDADQLSFGISFPIMRVTYYR